MKKIIRDLLTDLLLSNLSLNSSGTLSGGYRLNKHLVSILFDDLELYDMPNVVFGKDAFAYKIEENYVKVVVII